MSPHRFFPPRHTVVRGEAEAWESAWRSGSFPPTLARGWNRRSKRLAWETKLLFKNPPQITLQTIPSLPTQKIYLSLNYVRSFYKFHFTCYEQRFKTSKHTDSGDVPCQCCQLSGPTHRQWRGAVTVLPTHRPNTRTVERCSPSAANLAAQQVTSFGIWPCVTR